MSETTSANSVKPVDIFWKLDTSVGTGTLRKVTDLPEGVRTVPVHPDDVEYWGTEGNGPISPDSAGLDPEGRVDFSLGLRINTPKKHPIRIGVGLGLCMSQLFTLYNAERNYTNAPGTSDRGYGAALTYYKVGIGPVDTFAFADAAIVRSGMGEITVGARFSHEMISMATGWDRFDELEDNETIDLGSVNVLTPEITARINLGQNSKFSLYAKVGYNFLLSENIEKAAKGMNVESNNFLLSAGIGFNRSMQFESIEPAVSK